MLTCGVECQMILELFGCVIDTENDYYLFTGKEALPETDGCTVLDSLARSFTDSRTGLFFNNFESCCKHFLRISCPSYCTLKVGT